MLFMLVRACSASDWVEKRTKPKPRLRLVSRSLTTTCIESESLTEDKVISNTYRFFNLAILLKSFSQRFIAGMPCKPARSSQWSTHTAFTFRQDLPNKQLGSRILRHSEGIRPNLMMCEILAIFNKLGAKPFSEAAGQIANSADQGFVE